MKTWTMLSQEIYLAPVSVWSPCSKRCNGGLSRCELKCFDENSTIKCTSTQKYFLEKECNIKPCLFTENMMIKVRSVFPKPQRFIKCLIKEGDVYFVRTDIKSFQTNPLVPVRILVNNSIISVLLSVEEKLFEINLNDIKAVIKSSSNPTCFKIESNNSRYKFCQLGTEPHATANEWINDIMQFKNECTRNLKTSANNPLKINFHQFNKIYDYYDWSDREALMKYILNNSRQDDFSKDQEILCKKMKAFIEKSNKLLYKLKRFKERKQNERGFEVLQIKEEIRQLLLKEKIIGDNIADAIEKLEREKKLSFKSISLKKQFEATIGQIKDKLNIKKMKLTNNSILAENAKTENDCENENYIKTISFYKQNNEAAFIKSKR